MAYIDPQAQLKADYADLGVTCGYIGNFERWGDDRRFYVFTRLSRKTANACDVSIPIDVKRGERGKVLEEVVYDTPRVRALLDGIRVKMNAGELHWVGPRPEPIAAPVKKPDPQFECALCQDTGEFFFHTDDCRNDDCVLGGDEDECGGQVQICTCKAGDAKAPQEQPFGYHDQLLRGQLSSNEQPFSARDQLLRGQHSRRK